MHGRAGTQLKPGDTAMLALRPERAHIAPTAGSALDAQQLVRAQAGDRNLGFGPFLDGATVFEAPAKVFADDRQQPLPLIIGSNSREGSLLKFRKPGWRDRLLMHLPAIAGWYEGRADDAEARAPLLFRDAVFAAPARWIAAHHEPSWLYRFAHVSAGQRGKVSGAGHAAEIAYVFDNLDALQAYGVAVDDDDRRLAAQLADCWVAFAREAAPQCAFAWPAYRRDEDRALLIDGAASAARLPDAATLDGVTKYFGPGGWFGG